MYEKYLELTLFPEPNQKFYIFKILDKVDDIDVFSCKKIFGKEFYYKFDNTFIIVETYVYKFKP